MNCQSGAHEVSVGEKGAGGAGEGTAEAFTFSGYSLQMTKIQAVGTACEKLTKSLEKI